MSTWERLDSKVYPLMPLQIMISVEALRTLVTLEGPLAVWRLLWVTVHLLHLCRMPTVEAILRHAARHSRRHPPNDGHLSVWTMQV